MPNRNGFSVLLAGGLAAWYQDAEDALRFASGTGSHPDYPPVPVYAIRPDGDHWATDRATLDNLREVVAVKARAEQLEWVKVARLLGPLDPSRAAARDQARRSRLVKRWALYWAACSPVVVRVTMPNGNQWTTGFNGDRWAAENYFLGHHFNQGLRDAEDMSRPARVEVLAVGHEVPVHV